MTDSYVSSQNKYSTIITVDQKKYLVQGDIDDQILMFRTVNELLECERDNVQKMLDGGKNQ